MKTPKATTLLLRCIARIADTEHTRVEVQTHQELAILTQVDAIYFELTGRDEGGALVFTRDYQSRSVALSEARGYMTAYECHLLDSTYRMFPGGPTLSVSTVTYHKDGAPNEHQYTVWTSSEDREAYLRGVRVGLACTNETSLAAADDVISVGTIGLRVPLMYRQSFLKGYYEALPHENAYAAIGENGTVFASYGLKPSIE